MLKEDLHILKDIVQGIGDSPATGFEDIRNLNISVPGLVSLGFKTAALTLPPTVSSVSVTGVAATDILTVSSTSGWFNGMAINFGSLTGGSGLSTGRVYWVGNLSGNTFKVYKNPNLASAQLADFTTDLTAGTLSSYTLGKPIDSDYFKTFTSSILRPYVFILDENGRAWWIKNDGGTLTTSLVHLGNDVLTSSSTGRGIVVYSQDIIVFRSGHIDRLNCGDIENTGVDFDGIGGWEYGVDTVSSSSVEPRPLLASRNGNLYYGGNDNVGRFDGTTATDNALDLGNDETVHSLGELGQYLLIGGRYDKVYPWNKNSPSFEPPIIIPEYKTAKVVVAGQRAYLFAGDSGRIYVTDGVSVGLFKKIPEHITAQQDPIITWVDAESFDNQLYFSFSATQPDGTALTTVGGVWGIDLNTGGLRLAHQASYGSYAGTTHLIIPNILDSDSIGTGLIIPWANGSTYGVDYGSTQYYTSYTAYGIAPLYKVGTPLEKTAINQLEISLDKPLAANEGVRVSYRPDRNTAFSTPVTFDFATYGAKQSINLDFPAIDLVTFQPKVEVTGTTTTPVIADICFPSEK